MSSLERNLMYGLSNAQAAATLAAVLIGYNIILPNGERLLNDDVLNGTVLLILITCIVSSLITEHTVRKITTNGLQIEKENFIENEKILIPIANPNTFEYLINLSIMICNSKLKDNLHTLNVINDDNASENFKQRSRHYLDKAATITKSVNIPLKTISRYDLNIASGIIHTVKEYEITTVIIGLHHKLNITDSFFGIITENLLKNLNHEIMIARFLVPVNTLKRIIIAVPPKAEYESGFPKWIEHFCRMSNTLKCRIHFFANLETAMCIQTLVRKKYGQTLTDFSLLDNWNDLLIITGQVSYDHLLVIISGRHGTLSYDISFELLPKQLNKYFSNNSFIVVYPHQQEKLQYTPLLSNLYNNESQNYEKIGRWFYKWITKK